MNKIHRVTKALATIRRRTRRGCDAARQAFHLSTGTAAPVTGDDPQQAQIADSKRKAALKAFISTTNAARAGVRSALETAESYTPSIYGETHLQTVEDAVCYAFKRVGESLPVGIEHFIS